MAISIEEERSQDYEAARRSLKKIERIVRRVLETDSRSRNNDLWLITEVWRYQGHNVFVPYDAIQNGGLASTETISRCRRKIQNKEGLYIPTDPKVAIKRGIKKQVFEDEFSIRKHAKFIFETANTKFR